MSARCILEGEWDRVEGCECGSVGKYTITPLGGVRHLARGTMPTFLVCRMTIGAWRVARELACGVSQVARGIVHVAWRVEFGIACRMSHVACRMSNVTCRVKGVRVARRILTSVGLHMAHEFTVLSGGRGGHERFLSLNTITSSKVAHEMSCLICV